MEVWTNGLSHPAVAPKAAARAEAQGFDGMLVVDSQNLAGDPYVGLALAVRETTHLMLGTGVTNPATRHPAATAAAIASVHVASGGRAVLGIGRGDSALAHVGLAPAPVAELERYVLAIRAYLRGDAVAFDDLKPYEREGARPIDVLGLADGPEDSRLHWLPRDLPPVSVDVVATGPRVLDVAGRSGDRVILAVGASEERVAWAAARARAAGATKVAAYVNVVTHDDVAVARRLVAGGLTTFARFSAMDGKVRTPIDDESKRVLEAVHGAYDMNHHTESGSPQASRLDDAFVESFGIVGPSEHCIDRLGRLVGLGIDRFVVVGPSAGVDRDAARRAHQQFVEDVLPAVKALTPPSAT
jgi:5,10-methylenetetrahydromethanopterin reductase